MADSGRPDAASGEDTRKRLPELTAEVGRADIPVLARAAAVVSPVDDLPVLEETFAEFDKTIPILEETVERDG